MSTVASRSPWLNALTIASAVTGALAFAPQAVIQAGRIREARRLRGRPVRGVAAIRGMALPVLEGALDRSVALAASMDTRGYGRRGPSSAPVQRLTNLATGLGFLAVAVGVYGVLDAGAPAGLGLPVLGAGCVALATGLFMGGTRAVRTRYRPDPWRGPEWIVSGSGLAALAGTIVAARLVGGGEALNPAFSPLAWPALPWAAVVGVALALAPAVAAPVPPGLTATPAGAPESRASDSRATDSRTADSRAAVGSP